MGVGDNEIEQYHKIRPLKLSQCTVCIWLTRPSAAHDNALEVKMFSSSPG